MVQDVMRFAASNIDAGHKVALITVTEKTKGTPGTPGQMIAVLKDGTTMGTVGGGIAEHYLINEGIKAIENNVITFEFDYKLANIGMACGGSIKGFCNVLGIGNKLIIFGGGHVSQQIAPIALNTGFNVTVVDDRSEFADYFKDIKYIDKEIKELDEFLDIDKDTYIIICTRGHNLDYEALNYVIDKPAYYIGLIGSEKKLKMIFEKSLAQGTPKELLDKVYAPIGIDIANGTPAEIAVSIISEIIAIKNKGKLTHLKDKVKIL